MLKSLIVLALCVIVKAQDTENGPTNVQGHDVNEKAILDLFQSSELSKDARGLEKPFIQVLEKPACCPYKSELVTNVQIGKEVCHVIFPISKSVYKTVCLCEHCEKECITKPKSQCQVTQISIFKQYVCCPISQICKIVYINVPTGKCHCV